MKRKKNEDHLLAVLQQYRGMVLKLAWQYWKRLPASTKMWVDPDDLIEEAYLFILTRANETYDATRSKQSTFLWTGISNLFLNFALSYQTQKRFGWLVSLDDVQGLGRKDIGMARVDTVDAVLRVYSQASEECRAEMRKWFGVERVKVKRSMRGKQVYQEFRVLAERNRLSPNDCRQLMRSGLCLS